MKYDVLIIGGGVVGCAAAYYASLLDLSVCVAERGEDVCSGTSKANSGIAHAGYDAVPGTMKAKMNVRGAELIRELSKTLDFPYRQCGSLVLCLDESRRDGLEELLERGRQNGVSELRIISGDEAREMESALSKEVVAALYAPTAGVVCPFGMTVAFAEVAASNGAEFRFQTEVKNLLKTDGGWIVETDKEKIKARFVVNAAGLFSDVFHNMVSDEKIKITPRKGEYVLFDREVGDVVSSVIFRLPGAKGKGVLVTPTAHGNLLVGPSATDIDDKEDTSTTAEWTESIKRSALESVPDLPYRSVITGFAGLRAHSDRGDFLIGESAEGFFDAAGIESPGLTSAPAIGEYLAGLIKEKSGAKEKENAVRTRKAIPEVAKLPPEERSRLIAENPAYGRIVCRCEMISEGEIVDAIRRRPGAVSLDGIKRRVRQGMGRCQAGFCTPLAIDILARELGITPEEVRKNAPGSEMIRG